MANTSFWRSEIYRAHSTRYDDGKICSTSDAQPQTLDAARFWIGWITGLDTIILRKSGYAKDPGPFRGYGKKVKKRKTHTSARATDNWFVAGDHSA